MFLCNTNNTTNQISYCSKEDIMFFISFVLLIRILWYHLNKYSQKKAIQKSNSEGVSKFGIFYDKKMVLSSNSASWEWQIIIDGTQTSLSFLKNLPDEIYQKPFHTNATSLIYSICNIHSHRLENMLWML